MDRLTHATVTSCPCCVHCQDWHPKHSFIKAFGRFSPAIQPQPVSTQDSFTEAVVGMKFRLISKGRFDMGSPEKGAERADGETLHEVV
jgi:hypothetical protein